MKQPETFRGMFNYFRRAYRMISHFRKQKRKEEKDGTRANV